MSDKTTIQVKKSTAKKLKHLKRVESESYDSVVSMLVADYDGTIGERWTKEEIEVIAQQVAANASEDK